MLAGWLPDAWRHGAGAAVGTDCGRLSPAHALPSPPPTQAIQEQPAGAAPLRALSDALRASLAEWFSVGLLQLRHISWERSSAELLEKASAESGREHGAGRGRAEDAAAGVEALAGARTARARHATAAAPSRARSLPLPSRARRWRPARRCMQWRGGPT